ncbi:MAG: hypothetical protein KC621_23925 [Myxococcales bacterium]|nr:hypothetical protein [Myxococcales bacterium]
MTVHRHGVVPSARHLAERFDPNTGSPLRVGQIWPPRLVLHGAERVEGDRVERVPTVWVRHLLRDAIEVTLRPSDEPAVDSEGRTVSGLEMERVRTLVGSGRARGVPLLPGEEASTFKAVRFPISWSARLAAEIGAVGWIRKTVFVELSDQRHQRVFLWHVYLAAGPARVPEDDLPHFRWVDDNEAPLEVPGVARCWLEVPSPMSSPTMWPACWVQPALLDPEPGETDPALVRGAGPQQVELVCTWPVEPPLPSGTEAIGWNGAMGGLDPRPSVQPLAVHSFPGDGEWIATLAYWDTPTDDQSRAVVQHAPTRLEVPTPCVWPTVLSDDERPIALYDLSQALPTPSPRRAEEEHEGDVPLAPPPPSGLEVKVNLRVALPDGSEALRLERADLRLGGEAVGRWEGGPTDLMAGEHLNLRCTIDLRKLRDARDGRLKLTFVFVGRPTRGVVRRPLSARSGALPDFRTANGPNVRLTRSRSDRGVRTPWLVIDLGTEGTCAAVAFLDGFVPRVTTVLFDDGSVYPSKVWLSQALGGVYTLADEPSGDALYTTLVKLGLRFGDGAHPGCPDHIAATEVARFFLKRFLLEVRERTGWFPLSAADVLVSFPPRLAAMPRFVRSLRDTFQAVLEEVVWTDGRSRRLFFREEAFLVAVPCIYRDLQVAPVHPGRSRYYWVMDFGGGTTDVCGFLVTPDEDGEEHAVTHLTYPQRLPHHLSGNDVTRAFYAVLLAHLLEVGLVARADGDDPSDARRYPLPADPFPSARSTPTALLNQTALRELADAVKCLSVREVGRSTLRSVARMLPSATMRTADGVETTLRAMLSNEAERLGDRTVAEIHAHVLDPMVGRQGTPDPTSKTTTVCASCGTHVQLPLWVFASSRAFRYRCQQCGTSQKAELDVAPFPELDEEREGAPLITAWRDRTVAQVAVDRPVEPGELYLEQDGRTYVLRDVTTLRRWIEERRVDADDLLSDDGLSWTALRDRTDLRPLLRAAQEISVDTTQEVPPNRWQKWVFPEPEEGSGLAVPQLGRDIRMFLDVCREALERAVETLPDPENTDVVVLVAGRGSLFAPIADGVETFMPGRVVHLTNDWVRRTFGTGGQIDPNADLKTMTVNGGGLYALLHSNPETSQLLLSVDTLRMDVPVYLQSAVGARPWLIASHLDLRPGRSVPLVGDKDEATLDASGEQTLEEPPPRPLPLDTPLTGDLQLVVDGLPEDRAWEPYVVIAQGTARRKHGRRARTMSETRLWTEERELVLAPMTQEMEIRFTRMLPRLPLLGGD